MSRRNLVYSTMVCRATHCPSTPRKRWHLECRSSLLACICHRCSPSPTCSTSAAGGCCCHAPSHRTRARSVSSLPRSRSHARLPACLSGRGGAGLRAGRLVHRAHRAGEGDPVHHDQLEGGRDAEERDQVAHPQAAVTRSSQARHGTARHGHTDDMSCVPTRAAGQPASEHVCGTEVHV
eukprot:COSAG01_NODE_2091_length_8453_cov_19.448049_5_plen_179_part_00